MVLGMDKTKILYIFMVFVCLLSTSCGSGQSEADRDAYRKQYEEAKVFYEKKYSALISTDQAKVEVDLLITDRKKNPGAVINEIRTSYLVHNIRPFEVSEPIRSARLMLLLFQYSGAEGSEGLTEILTERFYKNPSIIIDALIDIEGELLPEFRNEQFLQLLYYSSCNYPQSVTEVPGFDYEKESPKMRKRLEALKNDKNAEIVDYLLNQM